MKRLFTAILVMACLAMVTAAVAAPSTMTGWVSDAKCAAKGANASHAGCAKACIKGGEKAVFVNDKDGKIYAITNQDSVMDHVGDHVTVTATAKGTSLDISKVEAAK